MTLLKLGQLVINMDRALSIRDLSFDDGSGTGPTLVRVEFCDGRYLDISEHAQNLLDWLSQNTTDLTTSTTT